MATLLARYLINEGSGSTIADSSGNGNDLTLTDTGTGGWDITTMSNGTSIYSGAKGSNAVVAQSDTMPVLLQGLSQVTIVMAHEGVAGNASQHRMFFVGSNSGNGALAATLHNTAMQGRWNYESGSSAGGATGNRVIYDTTDFSAVTNMQANMVTVQQWQATGTTAEKYKIWANDVALPTSNSNNGSSLTLNANLSWAKFCLLNRPDQARAIQGNIGYCEVWDGHLTAQEITDATSALLLDCNTAWDGGPPATSVSFTSEPAATNIDTDRVTANATAESDAI